MLQSKHVFHFAISLFLGVTSLSPVCNAQESAKPQSKQETKESAKAKVLCEVPITLTEANNISINAVLNGSEELTLMFHTANSGIVVTSEASKRLSTLKFDQSADMNSWGGQFKGRFCDGQAIEIGQLKREKIRVIEDELSGPGTDGKFGPDFFEGKVFELDIDANILRVHSGLPATNEYERLDIIQENGMMFLNGKVTIGTENHEKRFLIHSGFGGAILLDNDFVDTHDLASQLPTLSESQLRDSGGNVLKTRKVKLPALIIGGFEFTDTPTQIFEGSIREQKMSIIGGDILKRFNIIFDPSDSCIYLKKSRLFESDFGE